MKNYYITTVAKFHEYKDHFHPQHHGHYIDVGGGKILLAATWPEHEFARERWESDPEVHVLPRVFHEGTIPLKHEHVEMLRGHETLGCEHGDTILHVAKKAAAVCPSLKLTGL
ncbi:MAG TPA: hypothetical protein VGI16_11340 [Candidatus Acidoferrum sp.]|jgi:hypothetical protein